MSTSKRLVLLGGGHVNAYIVKHWPVSAQNGLKVVLVSEQPKQLYSGMLPGLMGGYYRPDDCTLDLLALCADRNIEFIQGEVTNLDLGQRQISFGSKSLAYDFLSINVGNRAEYDRENKNLVPLKPLHIFFERWQKILNAQSSAVAIVGGGAGGVEVALIAAARLRPKGTAVTLYEKSDRVLRELTTKATEIVVRRAKEVGLKIVTNFSGNVDDLSEPHVLMALPTAAAQWFKKTDLALNAQGFIRIDNHLNVIGQSDVFATGDCAELEGNPHAHAGVYAVRQAPILFANLMARTNDLKASKEFHPQTEFLRLITLGGREALLVRRPLTFRSKLNWWLKDYIDRKYMRF